MSDSNGGVAGADGARLSSYTPRAFAPLSLERVRGLLTPRYDVEGELGSGGTSVVYVADDRELGRRVAVKVLRPELSAAVIAARFLREIDLGRRLSHENVLGIYESGVADGELYFTMPFVEGETLRQRLARETHLAIEDTLAIASAVAAALDHAHAAGVIHRDIKPANILLGRDGTIVVADFGIARAMTMASTSDLTESGIVIGTAAYMSPEQGGGATRLDGRTDVYSLGCVVYEMLSGEPPFTGPTAQAIIARAYREEPRSLRVVRPTIPQGMERAVAKALAKVPSDRYATAGAFIDALRDAAREESPVDSARRSLVERMRRAPVRSALIVAIALVAIVGASAALARRARTASVPTRLFLAIRPFKGTSDSTFGWLGPAIETQLANALFEAPDLSLRSQSALAPYSAIRISDDSLARLVGADFFVDGQIIPSGDSVGVTVQLIDPKSATVLTMETVRQSIRTSSEVLLDSVALRIKGVLLPAIGEQARVRMWKTNDRDTLALALRFRAQEQRWAGEALIDNDPHAAAARFQEADSLLAASAAREPAWTEPRLARAGLAARRALVERSISDVSSVRAILDAGIASAESVMRMNPASAEAVAYRGRLRWRKYLWAVRENREPLLDSAETDLRTATTARQPVAFAAQDLSEILYMVRSRFAEAHELAMQAYKLDAYLDETGLLINRIALTSLNIGDDIEAAKWCRTGLRRYPNQPQHVACLLEVMAWGTQPPSPDSAWALYRTLTQRSAADVVRWHYLLRVAAVDARAGRKPDALKLVAQVRKEMSDTKADRKLVLPWEAGVFFRLGDNAEGERLFEQYRTLMPSDATVRATGFPLRGYVAPRLERPVR